MVFFEWLIDEKGVNDFYMALRGVCYGGHQEIAKMLKIKRQKKIIKRLVNVRGSH